MNFVQPMAKYRVSLEFCFEIGTSFRTQSVTVLSFSLSHARLFDLFEHLRVFITPFERCCLLSPTRQNAGHSTRTRLSKQTNTHKPLRGVRQESVLFLGRFKQTRQKSSNDNTKRKIRRCLKMCVEWEWEWKNRHILLSSQL